MNCDQVERELAGGGTPSSQELWQHLDGCEPCRELWMAGGLLAEAGEVERELERLRGSSLVAPAETIERSAINLGAAGKGAAGRSTARWVWGAAAAGLLLLGFGTHLILDGREANAVRRTGGQPVMRGAPPGAPVPVAPIGEQAGSGGMVFSWTDSRDPADPTRPLRYRLVTVDIGSGETVFERVVTGSRLELAVGETAWIEPGRKYHWVVDPLDSADGQTSPSTAFWVIP